MTRWGIVAVVVALGLCAVAGGGAAVETDVACSVCTLGFGHVNSVAFSPDGAYVAVGTSGGSSVHIVDVATWRVERTLERHTDRVTSVSFSPDGTLLASGSADATVVLWDTGTWAAVRTPRTHENRFVGLVFAVRIDLGFGIVRQLGAALGRGNGSEAQRLHRPSCLDQGGGVLPRRRAARLRIGR